MSRHFLTSYFLTSFIHLTLDILLLISFFTHLTLDIFLFILFFNIFLFILFLTYPHCIYHSFFNIFFYPFFFATLIPANIFFINKILLGQNLPHHDLIQLYLITVYFHIFLLIRFQLNYFMVCMYI